MDKRKKLSGFHYHLKRLKKQEEHDKNQTKLDTFLSSETFYSPNNDSGIKTLPYTINSNEIKVHEIEMEGEESNQYRESSKTQFSSESRFENQDNLTGVLPFCTWEEISDWPQTLTNHNNQEIVMNSSVNRQLNSFPRNYDHRSFSSSFFCQKVSNGESHPRSWLIYSEKMNKIFCFCCKLFKITDTSLARTGSADWRHLSQNLTRHEVSVDHIKSFGNWIELKRRLQSSKTVDCLTEKQLLNEIDRWDNVLKNIISIIIMMASQNIAFRGSSDKLYEENN
ncbi:zinc finger MYM-type protein 5-like [Hydra vulgaris]|uniref:Zinc finger MYM-type protein 5-like n=1 Tax=Hydra vulgaris TaxID=6087 RepID=A0ABM4C8R3_HYDVU